jgi:hypothetical protein
MTCWCCGIVVEDHASEDRSFVPPPGVGGRLLTPPVQTSAVRSPFIPVVRIPELLRLHPALAELGLIDLVGEIDEAAQMKDRLAVEPILITTNGIILSGFGRWRLAALEGRKEVHCLEYPIGEDDAIEFILSHCKPRRGWNAFVRIQLALTLEPNFRGRALDHMRAGGRYKGSSKLTEPERLDVRSEIAATASVSVGNVTKVKQVLATACAELQDALRDGELSIHRAWLWRELSSRDQRRALMLYRGERGVKKSVRRLISKHMSKDPGSAGSLGLADLTRRLSQLQTSQLRCVSVAAVKVPGKAVFVSEDLLQILPTQEELSISCAVESHYNRF